VSLFKIEYLSSERGEVVDFRYFKASDGEIAQLIAKIGLPTAAQRGAQIYRVLDPDGQLIASGPEQPA
jgi:hypothetical protein